MRREVPDTHRQFARAMRNEPTEAEAALWVVLKGRKLGGLRFLRQHLIGAPGIQVLRFWNNEVLNNADGVAETVLAAAQKR